MPRQLSDAEAFHFGAGLTDPGRLGLEDGASLTKSSATEGTGLESVAGPGARPLRMFSELQDPAEASPVTRRNGEPIRMIAIDVDGTLLRSDKRLPKRVANAVFKATQLGVHVVLASARPPRSVRAIYEYLQLQTPSIHYNGALIHDMNAGRNVFHQPLPAALTREIIRFARRIEPRVVISVEVLDKWYTDRPDDSLQTATSRRFNPDYIGPFLQFLRQAVTKLMLLAPPEQMERISLGVARRFGDHVTIAISDRHLIQIIHPTVDKAAALARVANEMGVQASEVMSIGDAPNDIGMLRWSGVGVAVDNAWDRVRDAADLIVPSNDANGVAIAIEQFVLEPAAKRGNR